VHLYPNPVRDRLTVKQPFPVEAVGGTPVMDTTGELHLKGKLPNQCSW
jgi:hypothetical protein